MHREDFQSSTYLIYEVVKETLARTTSDPCHKDWGFFASSVGPGHRNLYRAANRGRAVHPWGNRGNAGGIHVACPLVRPYASIPLAVAAGLSSEGPSRTLAEMADEIAHHVLERMCPRLVERRSRL